MGEVYKARDTRLDRIVAIKILPFDLQSDPVRRQRFEQEARATATLNHPHICALFDVGYEGNTVFLVMEYVEGQTLADALVKGPLPLDQVLRHAIAIASALDHAHRHGIVHRDVKPANIMITRDGVKLLDFGVAKSREVALPRLATVSVEDAALLADAAILGTVPYMAPEQLEGKEADERSDIFALGVVMFEMATGHRAFVGRTQAGISGAILRAEPPPLSVLRPGVSPAVDRVVTRCLAKDPDDRWQTARDLMMELKWIADGGATTMGTAAPRETRARRSASMLVAAAVVAGVGIGFAWYASRTSSPEPRPLARFALPLPVGDQLAVGERPAMAISPDGTHLIYAARRGNRTALFARRLDSVEVELLPGTEDATGPFFAPDGSSVGFFAGTQLKRVSIPGGTPLTISAYVPPVTRGASWGTDASILFSEARATGLWRVAASGGVPQVATTVDAQKGELAHRWPELLPGGNAVLFAVDSGRSFDEAEIVAQDLQSGARRVVVRAGTAPKYVPTGHLLFARAGALLAAPFDSVKLEVIGPAVDVLQGLRTETTGAAQFSVSNTGTLVYVRGSAGAGPERTLVWVDRQGVERTITSVSGAYGALRLSPDGDRLALNVQGPSNELWIYDLRRQTSLRLSLEASDDFRPIWTPDGKAITYASETAEHKPNIYWRPADGTGQKERLLQSELAQFPYSWSPDGRVLAYVEQHPATRFDVWILPMTGDRQPHPFLRTPFNESGPTFAPDGRWLAYVSDESGRDEVYVRPYPGPGSRILISTEGGTDPAWAPNGREIFYRSGNRMFATPVRVESTFTVSTPRLLYAGPYSLGTGNFRRYDVEADGKRFVMVKELPQSSAPEINIVLEWFSELTRRVPPPR
jgi:hypothetical protein